MSELHNIDVACSCVRWSCLLKSPGHQNCHAFVNSREHGGHNSTLSLLTYP